MANFLTVLTLAGIVWVVGYGVYLERQVEYWDKKIDQLCAADGGKNVGLRVYERVMAPPHYIRPANGARPASIFVPARPGWRPPNANEPIVNETVTLEVLRETNPRVVRSAVRITRVADKRVLAEEIYYRRSGGGIPMPEPSGSHKCPIGQKSRINTAAIVNEVFINHPLNLSQD